MNHTTSPNWQQHVENLGPWFHNLHLPDGTQTAPDHFLGDFPREKWQTFQEHIPEDLSGWTVLDIGCNAGFYSLELARRGAEVTAIDYDERYLAQARWAAQIFGLESKIHFEHRQVYDLAADDQTYDLVWFMGVLYHLRYPLLGLDIVARKTRKLLVLQTMSMPDDAEVEVPTEMQLQERDLMLQPGWPKMAFIEHQLERDPTNWWAPNHACIQAMLRSCGLKVLAQPAHEIYLCQPSQKSLAQQDLLQQEFLSATGQISRSTPHA